MLRLCRGKLEQGSTEACCTLCGPEVYSGPFLPRTHSREYRCTAASSLEPLLVPRSCDRNGIADWWRYYDHFQQRSERRTTVTVDERVGRPARSDAGQFQSGR